MRMDIGAKPMKVTRVEDDGTVTTADILGDDHGNGKVYFKLDADVEVGDEVSQLMPSGKARTLLITEVHPREAPGGMPSSLADLNHTECIYEVVNARTVRRQPSPVTVPSLHHLVSVASGSQVASGHYDDAVFNALKAVEDRVKTLTASTDIGKKLMTTLFNERAPLLDITSDHADAAQADDEREGYKFLFMGAAQALRNPRGHGGHLQTGEAEAMEMLVTASLLMRALDRAEKRQAPKPAKTLPPKPPVPAGFVSWAGGQQ